eukprot:CAMPEP_0198141782 /NCGR_PEP_ID=MMETSP1443-20131203/4721_1 /TAXON_ID=186043 /ORGANISM="Entomoneis sp., Strain CCMP2396" /LENGTH=762 /DNA_ID=CAMNT_0043804621 /DNA_START=190 /DNA_END=2478 /DNA_ORIENTATION=+
MMKWISLILVTLLVILVQANNDESSNKYDVIYSKNQNLRSASTRTTRNHHIERHLYQTQEQEQQQRELALVYGCGENRLPLLQTLANVLSNKNHYTQFYDLVMKSNAVHAVLQDKDASFTVFAPLNNAFEDTWSSENFNLNMTFDRLRTQAGFELHLQNLLEHHIVPNNIYCKDNFTDKQVLPLLNQEEARINLKPDYVFVRAHSPVRGNYEWSPTKQMAIMTPDQNANNGVIHGTNRIFYTHWMLETIADRMANLTATTIPSPQIDVFFQALAATASITEKLSDNTQTFTVFAPNDAAWRNLESEPSSSSFYACIFNTPELLQNVLEYHILISGVYSVESLENTPNNTFTTMAGEVVQLNDDLLSGNSGVFVNPNILASNGLIHEINAVLIPLGVKNECSDASNNDTAVTTAPTTPFPTTSTSSTGVALLCNGQPGPASSSVWNLIQQDPRLDTFEKAWVQTGLDVTFLQDIRGPVTIFAPTNVAFQIMDPTRDPDVWGRIVENSDYDFHLRDLLLQHVTTDNEFCAVDFVEDLQMSLENGNHAKVHIGGPQSNMIKIQPYPNDYIFEPTGQMGLVDTDTLSGFNGVVHTASKVFLTKWIYQDLMDVIVEEAENNSGDNGNQYSIAVELIRKAGLESELRDMNSPKTLLLPSNQAFENLPGEISYCMGKYPEVLLDILKHHILPTVKSSLTWMTQLQQQQPSWPTLLTGYDIQVTSRNATGGIKLNGETGIVEQDWLAYNGIVHTIDTVLLYPDIPCGTIE